MAAAIPMDEDMEETSQIGNNNVDDFRPENTNDENEERENVDNIERDVNGNTENIDQITGNINDSTNDNKIKKEDNVKNKSLKKRNSRDGSKVLSRKSSKMSITADESDEENMALPSKTPARKVPETPSRRVPETPSRRVPETPSRRVPETPSRRVPETPSRRVPETPSRRIPETPSRRQMSKKNSQFNMREGGVLGSKNVFRKTAKYALQQSKVDGDSDEEEKAPEEVSRSTEETQKEFEKADKILRGEIIPDPEMGPNVNKAWKAALSKLELVLPGMAGAEDEEDDDSKLKDILENIKMEMHGEGVGDLQPTVNGLRQFGIAKSGISRAVVNFTEPPTMHPLTVCFQFPHTILNHKYVKHMVLSKFRGVPDSKILMIQFEDRNVFHGTRSLDNRWIIRVSPKAAFDALLVGGIEVCNRKITMRPYDDVLRDEYNEYVEYVQMQKRYMYDKISNLSGTVPKKALNILKEATNEMIPDPVSNHGVKDGASGSQERAPRDASSVKRQVDAILEEEDEELE